MTKEELRIIRLKNEYKELLDYCQRCAFITSMKVMKSEDGAPVEYLIETNIRTYISETETTDHCVI